MKLPALAFIIISVFSTALHADDYTTKESFSQTGAFSPTGTVTVENVNGDVDIRTWDKNEILIEGEKSAKTGEELKLIDLTIDLTESRTTIKVRLPKRSGGFFSNGNIRASVRFKILVPATAVLEKIEVVNAVINIKDIRGSVHAESVNGRIHAFDLGGDVHLETVNGEIDASLSTVVPGRKLSFETVNGSIDVALPESAGVDVHATVVNGRIDCDFPLNVKGGFIGKSLSGKIGDGRASLKAESVNGGIHLKKR